MTRISEIICTSLLTAANNGLYKYEFLCIICSMYVNKSPYIHTQYCCKSLTTQTSLRLCCLITWDMELWRETATKN